jgi:3-hydroxyisobutyrate dehydrogenase
VPTLSAGAAGNWFLEKRGATMLADNFTPGFKCALLHKDLRIVREMAREAGVAATVVEQSLQDYGELIAAATATKTPPPSSASSAKIGSEPLFSFARAEAE